MTGSVATNMICSANSIGGERLVRVGPERTNSCDNKNNIQPRIDFVGPKFKMETSVRGG